MLRKSRDGIVFNEHLDSDGAAIFQARLQARLGRHCLEAPGRALSVGAPQVVAQDQEPEEPGDAAGGGWDVLRIDRGMAADLHAPGPFTNRPG